MQKSDAIGRTVLVKNVVNPIFRSNKDQLQSPRELILLIDQKNYLISPQKTPENPRPITGFVLTLISKFRSKTYQIAIILKQLLI